MMIIVLKILFWVYLVIAECMLLFHLMFLPMVTLPLMVLRSAVWPLFILTGIPHGTPLPMD